MALKSGTDRALNLIRTLPRIALNNLQPNPGAPHKDRYFRGYLGRKLYGHPQKGPVQRQRYPKLGYDNTSWKQRPWFLTIPYEPYYKNHHLKRQYPPISLHQLQLLIDTNRINPEEPIDIIALANTKIYTFHPYERHFGFHLTLDGADIFQAKINIEVQWATEAVIAAVERAGGTITTAYYDVDSLFAAVDAEKFFNSGSPIPKRMIPPQDAMEYYSDPKFRGYLADPDKIAEERLVLAQKYGYVLPDLNKDPKKEMLLRRKDPRQLFFGLEPGWVVNMRDKCILKPKDPFLLDYYKN